MTGQLIAAVPAFSASVCAGAAAWLVTDRSAARRRLSLLIGGPLEQAGRPGRMGQALDALRARPELWCLPAGGALALLGGSWLPLLAGGVALPLVGRRLRARRRAVELGRRGDAVIELCAAVAGGLRAGRQPHEALLAAVPGSLAVGSEVLAAARFGGDVPASLHKSAEADGAGGLRGVAACWTVAADGGAGLADGLDRVAAALRAERSQDEDLAAQLAGPRSTALLLALLPLIGLLMGSALGAAPLRVLLHTPAGMLALVLGGLLEWAGLAWTARIVRGVDGR